MQIYNKIVPNEDRSA